MPAPGWPIRRKRVRQLLRGRGIRFSDSSVPKLENRLALGGKSMAARASAAKASRHARRIENGGLRRLDAPHALEPNEVVRQPNLAVAYPAIAGARRASE